MRNTILIILLAAVFTAFVVPVSDKTPQVRYVEKYAALAVDEMYRSGVPASITLAQGLLESRYGLSELATEGNNHFGIKCHNNWQGGKVYHDDDKKGECFRKYDSPEESFRDHSDFLRYRDRYKFLFDLEVNDYKGWAHGLKKAGYATDPAYPAKLIKLIEDYKLYKYDVAPSDYGNYDSDDVEEYVVKEKPASKKAEKHEKAAGKKEDKHADRKKDNKKDKKSKSHKAEAPAPRVIPDSPAKAEAVKVIEKAPDGEFSFSLSRQMYSLNGVPFVYAASGDTYASLAKTFDLFPKEILKFNDLSLTTDMNARLQPGTLVYVQAKKKMAAKGIEKHVIEADDTLRGIAQRYGVKLESIYKMNAFDSSYVPREGDIIKLRD
jgi:hypothetical protein